MAAQEKIHYDTYMHPLQHLSKIIAHRGASYYAPENTLAAIRKAHALNIPWVEFDVTLTKDGVPVVFHDDTLDRTTNGRGFIADTQYADVAKLDTGSWFSPEFCMEKVPTFVDMLQCAQELNLGINVEIKPSKNLDRLLAKKVVAILHEHWQRNDMLLVSSFSLGSLSEVRQLDSQMNLGLLIENCEHDNWKQNLNQLSCVSLHVEQSSLTKEWVAAIKKLDRYVLAYTVDDPVRAKELYNWGVNAVFSNKGF
jgi:glycerophosphoryl diester phosphodiesterase